MNPTKVYEFSDDESGKLAARDRCLFTMFVFPGNDGAVRARRPCKWLSSTLCERQDSIRSCGGTLCDIRVRWVVSGGDVFRLSKMLRHANFAITQKTYAHLAPEAWQQDYERLASSARRNDEALRVSSRRERQDARQDRGWRERQR